MKKNAMPRRELPSEEDLLKLKEELNFLLWTNDPPPVPSGVVTPFKCVKKTEASLVNMQCVAHTLVAGALFLKRGFSVVSRLGQAYVMDTTPDRAPTEDYLANVCTHWWITLDNQLMDLSLFAESENPLIFGNRSQGNRWGVVHKDITSDWRSCLDSFRRARMRGVFYISVEKKTVTYECLMEDTAKEFPGAKEQGVALSHDRIIEHCDRLLSKRAESLKSMSQMEAWQILLG